MSDELAPTVVDAPELGQAGTGEPIETVVASEPQILDTTPYADHVVAVKVNGEELNVPLKEALAGYQRQEDYTRKTQEIAERQKDFAYYEALDVALRANPEKTIEYLRSELGLVDDPDGSDEEVNPLQADIQELRNWQSKQQIRDEFAELHSRFGDFDEQEVLKHAVDIGAKSLEAAYAHMILPSLLEEVKPTREAEAKRKADEAAALAAKREAEGLVAGGHTSATGIVQTTDTGRPLSLRESLAAAAREHGITFS